MALADGGSTFPQAVTWIGIVSGVLGILAFFGIGVKLPAASDDHGWMETLSAKLCDVVFWAMVVAWFCPWFRTGGAMIGPGPVQSAWSWQLTSADLITAGTAYVLKAHVAKGPRVGTIRPFGAFLLAWIGSVILEVTALRAAATTLLGGWIYLASCIVIALAAAIGFAAIEEP